jgi:hypothetical protein
MKSPAAKPLVSAMAVTSRAATWLPITDLPQCRLNLA